MTVAEKQALRAQHDCVLKASSMGCRACNRGVPYPALTVEEIDEALGLGRQERRTAERITKRSPRR